MSLKLPFFSCVIPVKGDRPFFKEALASLAAQGLGEELEVIVQDGTTEDTECTEIPEGLDVQWFREEDVGQSDALNRGFAKAKGEWLFWLNADDVLLPGALKKVKAKQHESTLSWIAGNMVTIDTDGRVVSCLEDKGRKRDYIGHPVRVYGPSSFFRKSLFECVGGFDVSLRYCMDTDLWCRFRDAGAWFEKIDAYLWGFRRHAGSTTTGVKSSGEQARQDAEVAAMHARRGVKMTAWDARVAQVRRAFDGSYARGMIDTVRFRGKGWREL